VSYQRAAGNTSGNVIFEEVFEHLRVILQILETSLPHGAERLVVGSEDGEGTFGLQLVSQTGRLQQTHESSQIAVQSQYVDYVAFGRDQHLVNQDDVSIAAFDRTRNDVGALDGPDSSVWPNVQLLNVKRILEVEGPERFSLR